VFDWNRVGLDGKPRELHVEKSLASIDFDDIEPALVNVTPKAVADYETTSFVSDPLFSVELHHFKSAASLLMKGSARFRIIAVLEKRLTIVGKGSDIVSVKLQPGQFCLIPSALESYEFLPEAGARFLSVAAGR
jgi:mannose-6-phosphate isomerase